MRIIKAHHTGLTVRSIDKSLMFYRDLLGLEEVFSWNPTARYIGEITGYPEANFFISVLKVPAIDYYIELLEYQNVQHSKIDHRNGNPGIAHVAFQVDDVERWFLFLKNQGIGSVSNPVVPSSGPNANGKIVYMIDPDGYRVELIQTSNSFGDFNPITIV